MADVAQLRIADLAVFRPQMELTDSYEYASKWLAMPWIIIGKYPNG